jgi:hypothetical protein
MFSFLCDQQQALWSPLHGFDPNQSTCQKIAELIIIHKIQSDTPIGFLVIHFFF